MLTLPYNDNNRVNYALIFITIDVNNEWIIRFYRNDVATRNTVKRIPFLKNFSKVSPLKIPCPEIHNDEFMAYKTIHGEHLSIYEIEHLDTLSRVKIAEQLGNFLKNLHNFSDDNINFPPEYFRMVRDDYNSYPKKIFDSLDTDERKIMDNKFKAIKNNDRNFITPTAIIHSDLHYKNILWDREKKKLNGVIDFAQVGLAITAMDFIQLTNFNTHKNDQFLKDILHAYGKDEVELFTQIKELSILEPLNYYWWYEKNNMPEGMEKIIMKLKTILHAQ